MSITIRFNAFDSASVQGAIQQLERLRSEQDNKMQEICLDIAQTGATRASLDFARTPYDGNKDVSVSVDTIPFGARVTASGSSVLFLEYGSGVKYGYGHPEPNGYGPGTYNPLSNNWMNPNGWYYAHGQKSWGNPPAMAMWNAEQIMRDRAQDVMNGANV